jgi:hypothetical protein
VHDVDDVPAEFPTIVPISTLQFDRSEQTAIAITGMSAYSNGFEIFVTRLIRPDALASTKTWSPVYRGIDGEIACSPPDSAQSDWHSPADRRRS